MIKLFNAKFNLVGRSLVTDLMRFCDKDAFDIQPIIGKHISDLTIRTHIGGELELSVAEKCFKLLEDIMIKLGERLILYLVMLFGFVRPLKYFKIIDTSCNKPEYLRLLKEIETVEFEI